MSVFLYFTIELFVTCTPHRNLQAMTKYKMREWYNLSVYLLLPALDACSAKPRLWPVLKEAFICLIVAVRAVSGYKPASALDEVRRSGLIHLYHLHQYTAFKFKFYFIFKYMKVVE